MNKFDFSIYDEEDDSSTIIGISQPKPKKKDFDFEEYEMPETTEDRLKKSLEKDKFYQSVKTPDYTPEEIKSMSFYDKMKYAQDLEKEQDYLRTRGSTKKFASRVTFGLSEKYEGGELLDEPGEFAGQVFGDVAPIAAASTLIGVPLAIVGGLLKFGPKALAATRIAGSFLTGSGIEGARQTVKGEGYDPLEIAEQGAEFALVHGLFEGIPSAYRWLTGLNPGQKAEVLIGGRMPQNLDPSKYNFFEQEVFPKFQQVAKQESEVAYTNAVQENDALFQQKMANTQANHEKNLYEISQKKQASQEDFARAQREYEQSVRQVETEHQEATRMIEQENQKALAEYQKQQAEYEQLKTRQQLVNEAIQPPEGGEILQGKVTPSGEDVGIRPTAPFEAMQPIEIRVGSIVSSNSVADTAPGGLGNKTTAGRTQVEAVRASDSADYKIVQDAYALSDELNSKINIQHSALVPELEAQRAGLIAIPKLSPVQEQKLSAIDAILDELTIRNEAGDIIGLNPVNNNVLQEQAKALRYFMDYNFQHGNSRGILQPTVDALEDGIAFGATMAGDEPALNAHKQAKSLYSQWAKDYDNPYIRPYRDVQNQSYVQTFDNSLNIDNFNALNTVLEKSNAGQQVAGVTKRALVDKILAPFYANPKIASGKPFNDAMAELRSVLTPAEESQIRNQFNIAKQAPPTIKASKVEPPKTAKDLKLKPLPEKPKISEFKKKPKEIKEPTVVSIPTKKPVPVSDAMRKAAHKLNMTNDDVINKTNSISGFRELSEDLLKTKGGEKTVENMINYKTRDILYEGNVSRRFTGTELEKVLNKGNNYDFIAEMHGDEVAAEWLSVAKEIADQKITADKWKKFGGKIVSLKIAHLFGIL